jgi:hypothetical protein
MTTRADSGGLEPTGAAMRSHANADETEHEAGGRVRARVGEAALVRLSVVHDDWAEDLPPAPSGERVTVSFGADGPSRQVPYHHRQALQALGYLIVGGHTGGADSADFLVPLALAEAHPAWWRALTEQAVQAFRLSMGPVARSLEEELRPHLRTR